MILPVPSCSPMSNICAAATAADLLLLHSVILSGLQLSLPTETNKKVCLSDFWLLYIALQRLAWHCILKQQL